MVARNFAQHESTGRIAGSIDYDPFAGVLESLKEVEERHHIAARTCEDPHVGQCGRQAEEKKGSSYYRAPHRNLPMVAGERGPRRRGSVQVYPHSMCKATRGTFRLLTGVFWSLDGIGYGFRTLGELEVGAASFPA
jgi:hypothetical protein